LAEDTKVTPAKIKAEVSEADLRSPNATRVPQYRRDIFPKNIVLSAQDLVELCGIVGDANERAKNIEFNNLDISTFSDPEQARNRVDDLIRLEHNYIAANGDSVQELGLPKVEERAFPDELRSFFVSNASYTRRAINVQPLNVVDVFLSFIKPSLKIDLQTLPSNPTENKSVVNVYGRDEDWVISTTSRLQDFLRQKRVFRPVIHGPGTYDYFIFIAFLPAMIWFIMKWEGIASWLNRQSIFLNVVLGIYFLFVSLLLARFVFQYFRWLFPPIEYYKKSRVGAYTHRIVFSAIFTTIILSAIYDLFKTLVSTVWK
jgi:hypothetical protein